MTEVVALDRAALEVIPTTAREIAVADRLTRARDELTLALAQTDPASASLLKAELVTVATASRELGLSKEIQSDAVEMVRRAEYAVAKAIRAGQAAGTIRSERDGAGRPPKNKLSGDSGQLRSPSDFVANHDELSSSHGTGIYEFVDGVSPEVFDAALTEAKAENDLTKANVARKVRKARGIAEPVSARKGKAKQGKSDSAKRTEPSRIGVTEWSLAAQRISGECPIDDLNDAEVRELHGAVDYLHKCLVLELATRQKGSKK